MSLSKFANGNNQKQFKADMNALNTIWTKTPDEKYTDKRIADLEKQLKDREEDLRLAISQNRVQQHHCRKLNERISEYERNFVNGNSCLTEWIRYSAGLENELNRKESVIKRKDVKATRLIEIIRAKNRELGELRIAAKASYNWIMRACSGKKGGTSYDVAGDSSYEDIAGRLEMIATIVNTNVMEVSHRKKVNEELMKRKDDIDDYIIRIVEGCSWKGVTFQHPEFLSLQQYLGKKKEEYYSHNMGELSMKGFRDYVVETSERDMITFKGGDSWEEDSNSWNILGGTLGGYMDEFISEGW